MSGNAPKFRVTFARTEAEIRAAQRLRYRVFVGELGADGPLVDHEAGIEADKFDPFADHLLLIDEAAPEPVVGVYRLLDSAQAEKAGQFYSEDEYDLSILKSSGRRLLELGRSCLDAPYRGGEGMFHLWRALAQHVLDNEIEILFGTASFHGTDVTALCAPLALLYHRHLAPEPLRVRTHARYYQPLDLMDEAEIDRRAAMLQVPALIKAYLRLGGYVGDGAFVDHRFNTTDVCLIVDVAQLSDAQKSIYTRDL